jgi:ornithine decarboxylase
VLTTIRPRSEGDLWLAQAGGISPALLFNPNRVRETWRALQRALPQVTLYYAVKSNPYHSLLATLVDEGAAFDVASAPEIQALLPFGVPTNRMIHTHPIKTEHDLATSVQLGVTSFVVDNLDELWKVAPYRHDITIMLRLAFVAPDAPIDLSRKFGAQPEDALHIMSVAKQMGITVDGLCFHVGSQAQSAETHRTALLKCIEIARDAKTQGIADIERIDIGGGFPANYSNRPVDFEAFCAPIREAIAEVPDHIRLMAEPGRAISAPSMTLVSRVIGRSKRQDDTWWYYLDDGVYGAQSGRIFDHINYPMTVFTEGGESTPAVFAGPTCDSVDRFGDQESLPELSLGDVIVIHEIGAYSIATACHFNGVAPPVIIDLEDTSEVQRRQA